MMLRSTFLLAALFGAAFAEKIKIGVMTDIHLQPGYKPDLATSQYCMNHTDGSEDTKTTDMAYFGRLGCDVPYKMVEALMAKMAADNSDMKALLIPGDIIGHTIPVSQYDDSLKDWQIENEYLYLMSVHQTVADLLEDNFTNIPAFPAFGNNDTKYHYQPATEDYKQSFYNKMFSKWFTQHSANRALDNLSEINETFMKGGYYKASIVPDKLTLLSFNSLQLNSNNLKEDKDEIYLQLMWLEDQLLLAKEGEKFIISMHIYETADAIGGDNNVWEDWLVDQHQEQIFELFEEHRDKILLEVTGHDHLAGIRTHALAQQPGQYYLNKVLFPGVTASSYTQPGFGTFMYDTETNVVDQLKFTFVNIQDSVGKPYDTTFEELKWFEVDFQTKFPDLKDLSAASIADFVEKMESDLSIARNYEFNRMGVDTSNVTQMADGLAAYQSIELIGEDATVQNAFSSQRPQDFVTTKCMMLQSKDSEELKACIGNGLSRYSDKQDWQKPSQN